MKKIILLFCLALILTLPNPALAEIERTIEPFSGAVTYTSKCAFSDDNRNMHSISLVRTIRPLRTSGVERRFETDTHFILNFDLQGNTTLGETFDIRISDNLYVALPLAPVSSSSPSMSAISTTARTGPRELLELVVVAIEKQQELTVRVNFSRGNRIFSLPAGQIAEWAQLLNIKPEEAFPSDTPAGTK